MRTPLLLLALLAPLPALAQTDAPATGMVVTEEAEYGNGEDYVPPVKHLIHEAYGVTYATGGVGQEEEDALDSIKSDFNLHILSTRDDGAYISGYIIRIIDKAGGAIFEGAGEGAWFLLNLKPGTYTVEETHRNAAPKTQRVTVPPKRHREIRFHWNLPKERPAQPPIADERVEPGMIEVPEEDEPDVEFVQ